MKENFEFIETSLKGAYIIKPFYNTDVRGGFVKDYNTDIFRLHGIDYNIKEVFYTISHRGVIRALHFQLQKQQAKLVRCVKGKIYDVIVDLRQDSETFGKWVGYELSEDNRYEIYIPKYFGHGYLVLEDSVVSYKCDEVFFSEGDSGIVYNDTSLGIEWPFEQIGGSERVVISEKDKSLMSFEKYVEIVCK